MSVDELTQIMEHEEPGRPRRALVTLLSLGLIGAVIAVFLVTQRNQDALAQLRIRDERVNVKPDEADFERGIDGQALAVGDTVRTSRSGDARIDYFDGSETRMDSSTTLVIGALLNEAGTRSVSIDQTNGRLWHRVERVTSSEDRYEVRTPNAVATVRGTTFATIGTYAPRWFYLGFDGETIVQVLKTGVQFNLLADDCITVSANGNIRRCTPGEIKKLIDEKIQEWKAEQGFELEPQASGSPSPSPSGTPAPVIRGSGGGGGGGPPPAADTPTPRGRKPSINTPGPDDEEEEEEESPSPPATETPTEEPTPTPTPTESNQA